MFVVVFFLLHIWSVFAFVCDERILSDVRPMFTKYVIAYGISWLCFIHIIRIIIFFALSLCFQHCPFKFIHTHKSHAAKTEKNKCLLLRNELFDKTAKTNNRTGMWNYKHTQKMIISSHFDMCITKMFYTLRSPVNTTVVFFSSSPLFSQQSAVCKYLTTARKHIRARLSCDGEQ